MTTSAQQQPPVTLRKTGFGGPRGWAGLAVLLLPMMLVMLDLGVMFLAIPYTVRDLSLTNLEALWVIDIYGFLVVGFLVTVGRLGDRIGRRRLLLIGAAAFSVLSVVAAFSDSAEMLIASRALLGVAGATIGPCVMALIKEMFPDSKQMATAFSLVATAAMLGVLLGPAVGGFLLGTFWWGSTFLIAVPVMLLVLVVGPFVLPESRDENAQPLDLASVGLSLAAMLPMIWGVTSLARHLSWTAVAAIAVGGVFGVVFARRQRRIADPLMDMRLFRIRAIGATLVMYLLVGIVQSGNGLVLTQHLQLVEGHSAFSTALWMVLPVSMAIGGVHLSTMLAKRFPPGRVLIGGLVTAAVGEAVLTRIDAVQGTFTLLTGLCIVMLGTSPIGVLSGQLVMHAAPPERAGSAGALNGISGEFGSALGIAVFGSLMTVFYSGRVAVPDALSDHDATAVNDTLVHATEVASTLPAQAADQVLTAARESFNTGVNSIAALCVLLFLSLVPLVHKTLRHLLPIGAETAPSDESK